MKDLIKEALAASPDFTWKMQYWIHKRKKQPDDTWLLNELAKALGEDRVKNYLQEKLNKQD